MAVLMSWGNDYFCDFLQNFLDGFPKKDLTTAIFSGERTQRSRILPERNSQK
jgi:hypothetical protein